MCETGLPIFQFHKVRLRELENNAQDYLNVFQFHKVRLREYGPKTFRPHYQFQFHKVRLRGLRISLISISF